MTKQIYNEGWWPSWLCLFESKCADQDISQCYLTVSVPFHSVFCVWETLSDIKQSWDD